MAPPSRSDFRIPAGLHYLNCAYMSPLPRVVEEAGIRGIRRKRVPSEIAAPDFFRESDELRRLFAGLIGAEGPRRIAIMPAASYGIAVAARNAGPVGGRNVVVARDQFPGNVYAWMSLARREGGELRIVDPPRPRTGDPGRGSGWTSRILEAVDADTAVVSLPPLHWTDGTRFDLEAIGKRAREVGALFVVDGTQSVGAEPFELARIQPDALVCASYKWLLGPYSLAVGYFGERFDDGVPLEEGWITRAGSEDFRGLVDYRDEYAPGAIRYDVGERSNFILVPMLVAALGLLREWTPEAIAEHCRSLTTPLAAALREEGFGVEEDRWRSGHILGVALPGGFEAERVRRELEDRRVHVSLRGSALRISPHVYNDAGDVEALLEALRAVAPGA